MIKQKVLTLLVLLITAATGAVAQVTFTCTDGTNFDGGEGMAKMFDGNTNTKFFEASGSDFYALVTASEPVYVWGYDWTTADDNESQGRLPKRWTLYGTNDEAVASNPGSDAWVVLSDLGQNNWIQQKNFFTQRFFCDKGTAEKAYKYFKITLTEVNSVQMSEFTFLYDTAPVVDYNWSSSSQDGAKNACDLRPNTKWEGGSLVDQWLIVESADGLAHSLKEYSFTTHDDGDCNNRAPKEWLIEGSNDMSTWVTVDEVTGGDPIDNVNYTTFSFTPANTTDGFRYYRLTLTSMKGTGWNQLAEFHVVAGPAILSYSLTLKEGTEDADNWTIEPNPAQAGQTVKLTYTGKKKVKSITIEKAPAPAATVTTAPTAKTGVKAGQNEAIVNAGTAEGGTMMYAVTTDATQPASTDGFSATVPTAEGLTAGTYYVWYYVKADDSHTDSEISATGIEVTIEAAVPTLAATMTTAGMTVKVNFNYNGGNYCLFLSNGDGTYTFQSGYGFAGGDADWGRALVVEGGKLVFKQNGQATLDEEWYYCGYSVTFDTSNNTYTQWAGEDTQENFSPSFTSVEVNGTQIAVTQQ